MYITPRIETPMMGGAKRINTQHRYMPSDAEGQDLEGRVAALEQCCEEMHGKDGDMRLAGLHNHGHSNGWGGHFCQVGNYTRLATINSFDSLGKVVVVFEIVSRDSLHQYYGKYMIDGRSNLRWDHSFFCLSAAASDDAPFDAVGDMFLTTVNITGGYRKINVYRRRRGSGEDHYMVNVLVERVAGTAERAAIHDGSAHGKSLWTDSHDAEYERGGERTLWWEYDNDLTGEDITNHEGAFFPCTMQQASCHCQPCCPTTLVLGAEDFTLGTIADETPLRDVDQGEMVTYGDGEIGGTLLQGMSVDPMDGGDDSGDGDGDGDVVTVPDCYADFTAPAGAADCRLIGVFIDGHYAIAQEPPHDSEMEQAGLGGLLQ